MMCYWYQWKEKLCLKKLHSRF